MSAGENGQARSGAPQRAARVEHFSVAERAARGKAARAEVPRKVHANWEPTSFRRAPVELLEEQAQSRVPAVGTDPLRPDAGHPLHLLPRRSVDLMAADLGSTPHSGLMVQLCGDAHLSNFGFYATPERNQAFDINNFDETYPGPFEWDVKASRGELRRRGVATAASTRPHAGDDQPGGRAGVSGGDQALRPAGQPWGFGMHRV